ncbi:LOW QUALITY PROTEIN: hypothetical protein PHMEG_00015357 [Phytophthora megakarya]|uniref:Integrase zinc-binding domain-containing protein n=1 Tax=Phytophthora megakarya TaxID=4795 RepID=A0A225W208_9STRA|nr:LOW QUALITY PROTEIN: hypothetical protein PHMEG_00015357 [Phytophthora megakarya]
MAEYSGMNNEIQAALDVGATDLVIVGDSRLAIQQSLGVIACKKESLMTQLNRHRELVARLKSIKYLHALRSLNRIQEVIYAPITESSVDEPSVSIAQSQVQTRHLRHMKPSQRSGTVPEPCRKTFFDFVRRDQTEIGGITVTTRLQAKSKPKRVRFPDETSVTGGEGVTQREEANGVPRGLEFSRVTAPNGNTPALPDAEDVDPLTVQRERRRRIATAQDEELRLANLKIVLRGEESTLTYRAARDTWKMSYHFVLSEDNVLYYNCHDSLEGGHQGIARTFYIVKLDYYWIGLYADRGTRGPVPTVAQAKIDQHFVYTPRRTY